MYRLRQGLPGGGLLHAPDFGAEDDLRPPGLHRLFRPGTDGPYPLGVCGLSTNDGYSLIMSLKAFHLIFISAATALAFGCSFWGLKDFFSEGGRTWDLIFGVGSLVVGVGLVIYERFFLKKLKHVSYLDPKS